MGLIPDFAINFRFEFGNVAEDQSEIRAKNQFGNVAKVDQSKIGTHVEFRRYLDNHGSREKRIDEKE